jgi:hypothetical protein
MNARWLALAGTFCLIACVGSNPSPGGPGGVSSGGSSGSGSGGSSGGSSGGGSGSSSGGSSGGGSGSSSGGSSGGGSGSSSGGGDGGGSSSGSSSGGGSGGAVLFNCNDLIDNCCLQITGTAYTQTSANTLCTSTGGPNDAVAGNTACQAAALVGTCAFPGAGANLGFTAFYYSSALTPAGDEPYTTATAQAACHGTGSFIPSSETGDAGVFTAN